jgi:glutathione S-transferase
MRQSQVKKEMAAHALLDESTADVLPWQHVMTYRRPQLIDCEFQHSSIASLTFPSATLEWLGGNDIAKLKGQRHDYPSFYHPYSRAAGTVWALEEAGVSYELTVIDIMKGEQKGPELISKNPVGKLPTLVDGDTVVTEASAIASYLADRYAAGRLAPALDDPTRGTYLRWAFFAPSVIEPAVMAKGSGWTVKEVAAGWGNYASMIAAAESVIAEKAFVRGDEFSMADVVFGGGHRNQQHHGEPGQLFAYTLDKGT